MYVQILDYNDILKNPYLLSNSFRETGFAVIKNHDVDPKLVQKVYDQWESFFKLPLEEKNKYKFNQNRQDGYFPFKSENAKGSTAKDLKEFYHIYKNSELPSNFYTYTNDLFSVCETKNLMKTLTDLGESLLVALDVVNFKENVVKNTQPFSKMIENSDQTLFRILHYPPIIENPDGAVRAAAHEDINLITLLPSSTFPGLQVKDIQGNWHFVDLDNTENAIIVNVGDMLQEASNGYYKSTTHRVVNPTGYGATISRYSMPLFIHPRPSVKLSERYTAEEYLNERLQELGLK